MQPVDERCGFNQVAFGAVGRQSITHLGQGQGGVRVGTIQVPVGGIKKHKLENMWGEKGCKVHAWAYLGYSYEAMDTLARYWKSTRVSRASMERQEH